MDVQLQPVRLARISGKASGSDGKPMSGAMVMLIPTMKEDKLWLQVYGLDLHRYGPTDRAD